VAVGGRLLGISGALLAVPITVVIQILIEEFLREEHE
jgi:predicted PurR-regulated permease PerM